MTFITNSYEKKYATLCFIVTKHIGANDKHTKQNYVVI